MNNNKVKAIIVSATIITIIIIAAATFALWPTQQDNNKSQGDKNDGGDDGRGSDDHSDGDNADNSKYNFLNIHQRIQNHTLISTTTTVVFGCLILIILLAKGYHQKQKRRKKENPRMKNMDNNPYIMEQATNGTWSSMGPSNSWSTPAPTWGHTQLQGQTIPGAHHHPYAPRPLPAPRAQQEEGQEHAPRGAGQEIALVHSDVSRANSEPGPMMGAQWKHNK